MEILSLNKWDFQKTFKKIAIKRWNQKHSLKLKNTIDISIQFKTEELPSWIQQNSSMSGGLVPSNTLLCHTTLKQQ